MGITSSTRIFAILASNAPVGVILRRGPSKQVLLIKWNLGTDSLECGQWFKGRIYERRCDLSPSGDLLLYFAAKHKGPLGTWTAISKPPYLTALALWAKGDAWGGGGLFETDRRICLNHRPSENVLAQGFRLKKNMRVALYGDYPGRGEDFPIYHSLLLRRGWHLLDEGELTQHGRNAKTRWQFVKPMTYEKISSSGCCLRMLLKGMAQENDAWYWIDYDVLNSAQELLFTLPRTDWADWDGNGDLVFARNGKLFRLKEKSFSKFQNEGGQALKLVADLTGLKFESKAPPQKATRW